MCVYTRITQTPLLADVDLLSTIAQVVSCFHYQIMSTGDDVGVVLLTRGRGDRSKRYHSTASAASMNSAPYMTHKDGKHRTRLSTVHSNVYGTLCL